jgi:hypothetical protein
MGVDGISSPSGGIMSEPARKLTVSEFIRESKPDWEHVRERERRASTGAFTGALQVDTGVTGIHDKAGRLIGGTIDMEMAVPFADQVAEFDEQNLSGETDTFFEETTRFVDDVGQEARVVGKVGSRVPR